MDFARYLETVERAQLNTFMQSNAGRAQLAKTGDSNQHYVNAFAFLWKEIMLEAPLTPSAACLLRAPALMLVTATAITPNGLSSGPST